MARQTGFWLNSFSRNFTKNFGMVVFSPFLNVSVHGTVGSLADSDIGGGKGVMKHY